MSRLWPFVRTRNIIRGPTLRLHSYLAPESVVNSSSTDAVKLQAALDNHLYTLAAVLALRTETSLEHLQQIVRGLTVYDPRLLPVNLRALWALSRSTNINMESVDKATLLSSLLEYGDQVFIRSGLRLLTDLEGGPVPVSALARLLAHAKSVNAVATSAAVWYYMRSKYPLTVFDYTGMMVDLMDMFSRNEKFRPLAKQVAEACLARPENPSIILSIAKVSYMLADESLAQRLRAKVPRPGPRVEGVMRQLEAKLGRSIGVDGAGSEDLTAQDLAGITKGLARHDVTEAEAVSESQLAARDSKTALLVNAALCNQYIHDGTYDKFMEKFNELRELGLGAGVLLNYRLKWELLHGTFYKAKRHYQNWQSIPPGQRAKALELLAQLGRGDPEAQRWLETERTLHGLRPREPRYSPSAPAADHGDVGGATGTDPTTLPRLGDDKTAFTHREFLNSK